MLKQIKPEKANQVQDIKNSLEQVKNWVFTDYQRLSVNQFNALRETLRKTGARVKVVKNKLLEKANPDCLFTGPTAVLLVGDNPPESLKALVEFTKNNNGLPEIKKGFIENRWLTTQEIKLLASLPSKVELLAKLCGGLKTPIARLVRAMGEPPCQIVRALSEVSLKKRGDSNE
ncbi:MAG: 50S ribosomal protein L10 [bacterium]|nr:50S ribosomal protein L10 [bacterium]